MMNDTIPTEHAIESAVGTISPRDGDVLRRIHADPRGCKDFILADAKDADMALAIGAPGKSPEAHSGELRHRNLAEFRDVIVQIVEQKLVDIMLMSASTSELLTIHRRLFDQSPVTPAARANDTTDIHIVRGSKYPTSPSLPLTSIVSWERSA